MSRTTEMALGIFGGLFGFAGALSSLFLGMVNYIFTGFNWPIGPGVSALIFSVFAVIGAVMVETYAKTGGGVMLISGIAILFSISLFGVVPALFLVSAGLMGIMRKQKSELPKNLAA